MVCELLLARREGVRKEFAPLCSRRARELQILRFDARRALGRALRTSGGTKARLYNWCKWRRDRDNIKVQEIWLTFERMRGRFGRASGCICVLLLATGRSRFFRMRRRMGGAISCGRATFARCFCSRRARRPGVTKKLKWRRMDFGSIWILRRAKSAICRVDCGGA